MLIQEILAYYEATRQVGHTTAVIHGAQEIDSIVVSHSEHWKSDLEKYVQGDAKNFRGEPMVIQKRDPSTPPTVITLADIEHGRLKGCNKPLVFDNAAIFSLLGEAVHALKQKNEKIKELNDKLDRIAGIASNR